MDISSWVVSGVAGLGGGLLGSLLAYRSQLRAMGPELRALWKERSLRHRSHIRRAARRGENLEDPGDAALAASLTRYHQAARQSPWRKPVLAIAAVLFGALGIAAAVADGPAWLALTAGALFLLVRQREGHYRGEWLRYRREHGRRPPWWWR